MNPDMRQALIERQTLIEQRAATLLDKAIAAREPRAAQLGPKPARLQQITGQLEQAGVRIITPHPSPDYAYRRIRDALLAPWDSDSGRDNEGDVDDHDPGEG